MTSQITIADIRAGKTSASSFSDDRACLGRRNLINALPPEMLEQGDDYTEFGNAVHKAIETGNPSSLSTEQYETYLKVVEGESQLLSEWGSQNNIDVVDAVVSERRLWITSAAGDNIASAQLDRYWLSAPHNAHALIVDVKSLFAPHLPRAVDSWQLRMQAVALYCLTGCENIRVAYNAPNKFGRKLDTADFTTVELHRDLHEIRDVCKRMSQPDAARTPGDACRYCNARGVCPEAAAYSMLPSIVAQTSAVATKKDVQARVAMLQPADWAFIHQRSSIIKNILEAASGHLRQLPEDQLRPLGFKLGAGRTTSEIPGIKTSEACGKLVGLGLPEAELWKCLSVNKTAVIELVMKEYGFKKDAAEKFYGENLGDLIESKTGEPILREV